MKVAVKITMILSVIAFIVSLNMAGCKTHSEASASPVINHNVGIQYQSIKLKQDTPKRLKLNPDARLMESTNRAFGQLDHMSVKIDKMAEAVERMANSNAILTGEIVDARGIAKKYKRKNDTLVAEMQKIYPELKNIKKELVSAAKRPTPAEKATWSMFDIIITVCVIFTAITSGVDLATRWFANRVSTKLL